MDSALLLVDIFYSGGGEGSTNIKKAIKFLEIAINFGSLKALNKLAKIYTKCPLELLMCDEYIVENSSIDKMEDETIQKNIEKGLKYYELAADKGSGKANYKLGKIFLKG